MSGCCHKVKCKHLILNVEQLCTCSSPLLMNSVSFVLDCQPIRRLTAGYEHVIIMPLQGITKLSPQCVQKAVPSLWDICWTKTQLSWVKERQIIILNKKGNSPFTCQNKLKQFKLILKASHFCNVPLKLNTFINKLYQCIVFT